MKVHNIMTYATTNTGQQNCVVISINALTEYLCRRKEARSSQLGCP
jgi:hypothetical protein